MANKPIWIVCSNKEWLVKAMENICTGNCPPPHAGGNCPVDKDGNIISCKECWGQYIDCEAISDE